MLRWYEYSENWFDKILPTNRNATNTYLVKSILAFLRYNQLDTSTAKVGHLF